MRAERSNIQTRARALSIVLMTEDPLSNQHHASDCSIEPTYRQALSGELGDRCPALSVRLGCEQRRIVRGVSSTKGPTAPSESLAEGRRFELLDPCGSAVFKTAALDHSATPPRHRDYRKSP